MTSRHTDPPGSRTDATRHDRTVMLGPIGCVADAADRSATWLPEARALFAGDLLFHGLTPLVFMGSVSGARSALEWIAAFEPEHVVPGHGPLIDGTMLARVLGEHDRYYQLVESTAAAGRSDGLSALDAARACDLGEFASWSDSERLVLNVHRVYADAADVELDLLAATVDTIEYHGGPMTTHVCCAPT